MPRPATSRRLVIAALSALVLGSSGCQDEEIGSVGPQTRPEDPVVADPDVKGKGKATEPVTRATRK